VHAKSGANHGKWIELTSEQWQLLRDIYVMNPLSPSGLPCGDRAALVRIYGVSGGMVFFIDGDKACTPTAVPDQLLAMRTTSLPPRSPAKEARSDRLGGGRIAKSETPMSGRKMAVTPSAYAYPLLIKQLLHTPLAQTPRQEIAYRDVRRLTYLELRDRIGRLASALHKIGVQPGDSVGVLDWDSNRFLEAFFAIPMMGGCCRR
jgi:hypothetical protein